MKRDWFSHTEDMDFGTQIEMRMHKMGHTEFVFKCSHPITESRPNADDYVPKNKCLICEEEIFE
jgi:hypothetical protein